MKFWKSLSCTAMAALGLACAASGQVVISQFYPAGGNTGASFNADYVELFNKGASAVDLSNWSVNYAAPTGTSWSKVDVPAGKTIAAGGYFLIKLSATGANGAALTPDVDGNTIAAGANNGKLVLMNINTPIASGTSCPSGGTVVDIVGYGTANCFSGAGAAPATSAAAAGFRAGNGCVNTGNNNSDFSNAAPAPRNSSTPTITCGATPPTGVVTTTPNGVCPGTMITLSVVVTAGSSGAPIASVTGDLTLIGGGATDAFTLTGPNTWTRSVTIATSTTFGTKSIPITIAEGSPGTLSGSASGSVIVNNCTLGLTTGTGFTPSAVCSGTAVTFTAIVRKNTINPPGTSTGISVVLDLTNVNNFAPLSMPMNDDGDYPNPGDNQRKFTLTHIVPAGQLSGSGSVGITLTDAQGNVPTLNPFNVTLIGPCTPSTSTVVISQVYGGGGNLDAPFQRDFIELFNRSSSPVDISGWSLQYAGATAAFNSAFAIPAGSIIQPGQYFLIGAGVGSSCAGSTPCGVPLPVSVDADGTVLGSIGSQEGKLILLSGVTTALGTGSDVCPVPVPGGGTIQDFIGYGGANCREGLSNAASLSNTTAAFRRNGGCQDNDQSAADFTTGTPAPRNSASPTNSCFTPTTDNCCRGTTCNSVTAGSCTGVVAGSNSIVVTSCGAGTAFATCCFADFNHDGIQSIDDLFLYFNAYFTASPWANVGGDGTATPTIDDLFLFINAYFGTCAP